MRTFLTLLTLFVLAAPAHAQISTDSDESFIQLTPEQQKAITGQSAKPDMEITGGDTPYVPAPRQNPPQEEKKPEEAKSSDTTVITPAQKGYEVCDVVAQIISRDFRVIVTNPHFRSLPVATIGSGPYEVAVKSIVPYANVYMAMGCDGKKLQSTIAGALKQAMEESKGKKK